MPQTTLTGEDIKEDSFWAEGSFMETMGPESKAKMRTFHMNQKL